MWAACPGEAVRASSDTPLAGAMQGHSAKYTHTGIHLRSVHFIVCVLYLNKRYNVKMSVRTRKIEAVANYVSEEGPGARFRGWKDSQAPSFPRDREKRDTTSRHWHKEKRAGPHSYSFNPRLSLISSLVAETPHRRRRCF